MAYYGLYAVGHLLVGPLSFIEIVIPIINTLNSLQLVIQTPFCHMTRHAFRSREAAEGASQVVDGEVLQVAHFVGWLHLPASLSAK